MPKFTVYATYYYTMTNVEAESEYELYQLLREGDISPMNESPYAAEISLDVEAEDA